MPCSMTSVSRRHGRPVAESVGFFGDVFPLGVFGESGGLGIAHPRQPLGVDGEMLWRLVDSGDIGDGAHGLGMLPKCALSKMVCILA
jgi:hypothetical protein